MNSLLVCVVSGCGNEPPPQGDDKYPPLVCTSCRAYAVAKVLKARAAAGVRTKKVRFREMIAALGVNLDTMNGPRTGRR